MGKRNTRLRSWQLYLKEAGALHHDGVGFLLEGCRCVENAGELSAVRALNVHIASLRIAYQGEEAD